MRNLAEEVKARARIGEDVIGEKKAAAAEQKAAESAATVGALIKVFLAEREQATRKVKNGKPVTPTLRVKTHEQTTRYLNTHCAALHGLVVGTVTRGTQTGVVDVNKRWTPINGHKLEIVARSHVVDVIDEVARNRGRVSADRCKAAISTFYVWWIDQGYCDLNPTMHIKARSTNGARECTLSDQELAEVWHACRDDDYGRIVRLLILTGQRRVEIGDLSCPEVDLGERLLKLPAERIKTNRSNIVWLADQSLAIIKSIPGWRA